MHVIFFKIIHIYVLNNRGLITESQVRVIIMIKSNNNIFNKVLISSGEKRESSTIYLVPQFPDHLFNPINIIYLYYIVNTSIDITIRMTS